MHDEMYVLVGYSLVLMPLVWAMIKYDCKIGEALAKLLFGANLEQWLAIQFIIRLGALITMYGWYRLFAVWR